MEERTRALVDLRVENFRGCRYAYWDFRKDSDNVTVIGGKNHMGKSSFLDGLLSLLAGKKGFPVQPIMEGEDEAELEGTLDVGSIELPWPVKVTRKIWRKKGGGVSHRLTITDPDDKSLDHEEGAPTPQEMLTRLLGRGFGFDPHAWLRMKPKEQVDKLKEILGIDFAELDLERSKLYDQRTEVNRDVVKLQGQIKGIKLPNNLPVRVTVADLMDELTKANDHNAGRVELQNKRRQAESDMDHERDEIDKNIREISSLKEECKRLEEECKRLEASQVSRHKEIKAMVIPEPINTQPIQERIKGAEEINKIVDASEDAVRLREERSKRKRHADKLTSEIESIDKKKRKMIEAAEFPIDGLSFDADGIMVEGRPMADLSTSEQDRVAFALACKSTPEFPVVLIRDGSLLDSDSFDGIKEMVAEFNAQLLVEMVRTDNCSFVFEDGEAVCGA